MLAVCGVSRRRPWKTLLEIRLVRASSEAGLGCPTLRAMTGRIGRGGRKGQTHTATPKLRDYEIAPASAVTVTSTDGSTRTVPAQKARTPQKPQRRRGPLVCAICGHPATDSPTLYGWQGRSRGKPVHGACDPKATAKRPQPKPRAPAPATPPKVVGSVPAGTDPQTAWRHLSCTQCGAQPMARCVLRYSDGTSAETDTPHRERAAAGRRALLAR